MKKKLLGALGILVIFAVFYQQILLVGFQIALYCFLPKTFSYQKVAWDKNVLQIQGLIKEKGALSVDSVDIFYQDGSFHIRVVHPQCLLTTSESQNFPVTFLGLHRFLSIEVQHGVLELDQQRYYFSLLPKATKELELKLAMDPDPLYPALLHLHYYPSNQIHLSIISQELKHLLPLAHLWGYFDRENIHSQAKVSVEANGVIDPTGYIQDINLKTFFADVEVQYDNQQWCCDRIEAELHAAEVHVEDLWHSCRGNLHLQNGSYALLSQDAKWQKRLLQVDLVITEQSKGFLSGVAANGANVFPLLVETTCVNRDQKGIKMQATFSDLADENMQGDLVCELGKKSVIECNMQKFGRKHLDWAISCFSLPQMDAISYEWASCSAKVQMLFLDAKLQNVVLDCLQAKDLSICSASNTFIIKNAQLEGKWDANTSRISKGRCQLEQAQGLDIVIEYPGKQDAIYAHIQGDVELALDVAVPLTSDLVINENTLQATGSILHAPFLAEAMLVKPLFSLENGINVNLSQGYIKLEEITEEQYKPWLTSFLPNLVAKGKYQLECLFDTNKIVVGVEGEEIHAKHFDREIDIPKLSELVFQYQDGKWGLHCPRLVGNFHSKENTFAFKTTIDGTYPQLNIQNLSLKNKDFFVEMAIHACYQDMLNLKLQATEIKQKNHTLDLPFLAEVDIYPESTADKIVADLKSLFLPINSTLNLEEGVAKLEWNSHTNTLCITQGRAKICDGKKTCYFLQIDSLIGAIDFLTDVHFAGSLQMEETPILQTEGVLSSGLDNWRMECSVKIPCSEIGQLQLSIEKEPYRFSCLGKDISISGQKVSSDWYIDQIQIGPLTANAIVTNEKNQLHCKSIKGSYQQTPFLASGVFDWQTHAICGQADFDTITVKSEPFICEYSAIQGFFSKQIDLTVEDLKSSEVLARFFCHSASYREKILESTVDFSLPAFHVTSIPITWDLDVIGKLEIKHMPGLMQINGNIQPGDLAIQQQPIHYQNVTFSLENDQFTLNSECKLGSKPFWAALELRDKLGTLQVSEQAFQTGLKSCFHISSNECKIHNIKGKACGITAELEAKSTNHLQGTLQVDVSNCASFVPCIEKVIQPLQLESSFFYQGEISQEGCTGLLQADQLRIKGFSVEKFSAGINISPREIQIYDFSLSDQAGSLFAKTIHCKKLSDWELWIPEIEVSNLQIDHILEKSNPFIVNGTVKDMRAQLSDLQTLHAVGQCSFQSPQKNSFFDIPLEILSKIGLELHSFVPVEGELEFKIQQNRCYLTRLTKAFSKNGRCLFALSKKKKHASYIGFDGSLSIDLQLKQKKLLKIIDPFTFTIRGTLDRPKYSLVLLKE